jgi:hypothetical protein
MSGLLVGVKAGAWRKEKGKRRQTGGRRRLGKRQMGIESAGDPVDDWVELADKQSGYFYDAISATPHSGSR